MKLAWKELRHDKKKYILVEVLLILMIFMVLFLSGLVNGLGRAVSSGVDNMNVDYVWMSEDAENLITVSHLEDDQVAEMQKQVDGESAPLDIQRVYIQQNKDSEKLDLTYFGMEPGSFLMPEVTEGTGLSKDPDAREIVLNDSFKEDGIKAGDTILDSATGTKLKVVGFVKDTMYAHIGVGVVSLDTFDAILSDMNPAYTGGVHALAVKGTAEESAVAGTSLVTKEDVINDLPGYEAEQMTINMVLWVMVILSAAILGVFFFVLTIQKEKQFGILKAIGVSMGELTGNLLSQMLILSLFGAVIGNVLAFAMAAALPAAMPFYLTASNAAVVTAAFILVSLLGALISIRRVGRVDPLTSIGGNA